MISQKTETKPNNTTMVIAVDVDSVVCDTMKPYLERYNKDYHDSLTKEDIKGWDIEDYVVPIAKSHMKEYFADPTLYDDALPIEGAIEGVNALRMMGLRVIFPTVVTPGSEGAKKKWLLKYGFLRPDEEKGYMDYIELADKTLIRAYILLDDNVQNAFSFPGIGIIFDQPWNRNLGYSINRVYSWPDFIRYIYEYKA